MAPYLHFSAQGVAEKRILQEVSQQEAQAALDERVSSALYMQHTVVAAYALHPEYRTA